MKINQIISETTTAGSVASVAAPMGKVQKRAGSMFKGKKTNKPFYEAELQEDDLILVPGQGHKLKSGFIPHEMDRRDHEVEMARSDLYNAAKNAKEIYKIVQHVSEDEGLEGWVQEKIIKANDYLNSVREYLEHKVVQQESNLGGVVAGGIAAEDLAEGAKVDRMVKHIAKSERELGKSKDEAENIAWATVNKRGYLDNKNKKKAK